MVFNNISSTRVRGLHPNQRRRSEKVARFRINRLVTKNVVRAVKTCKLTIKFQTIARAGHLAGKKSLVPNFIY
jgi:hypothetical protein